MTEDQFQIQVMKFLDLVLPDDARAWHVPNGGYRTRFEGANFKRMGVRAGHPDIDIVYQGKLYCLELKVGKNTLTDKQKAEIARLRECAVPTMVCRKLDDVGCALSYWSIPLKFNLSEAA